MNPNSLVRARGLLPRAVLVGGFLSAVVLLTAPVIAQTAPGPFRLGLEGNAVAHDKVTLSASQGAGSAPAATTNLGLPGAALGVALGYSVTPNVLLGGRLLASSKQTKVGDASADSTSFAIVPHAEYVFDGAVVRPFLAAHVGYGSTSSKAGELESSTSSFLIGPGAGLHAFVASAFSIDAGLVALLQQASAKTGSAELSGSGYTILATIGLSGWLGGSSEAVAGGAAPAPVPAQVRAEPAPPVVAENADGALETSLTLDLPNAAGGVQITLQGDPRRDASAARVLVTWLRAQGTGGECSAAAFESGARRTELGDVQSFSREGFSSSQLTQQGTLPIDVLDGLSNPAHEARLMLCSERVIILPAAKRRVARFVRAFQRRLGASEAAQPKD